MSQGNTVLSLLRLLDVGGIPYVSWKNNHELGKALEGKRDLDLFIPNEHRANFMALAEQQSWLCVDNPVARFPWVIHLYKPDESLRVFHLHIYFKVVTGESWLKEYVLPLDRFLLQNRVRSTFDGVWVLCAEAQAYVFAIRHLLKSGSISSRLLYRRELGSYRQEWLTCSLASLNNDQDLPIQLTAFLSTAGLSKHDLAMPSLMTAVRFRTTLLPLMRVPWWTLTFRRARNLLIRVINRYIVKRKKLLPYQGVILAVSGVDGAGKSTMLDEAFRFFSTFLSVERLTLGRPQGKLVEWVRLTLWRTYPRVRRQDSTGIHATSVLSSVSAVLLAFLRLSKARRAIRLSRRGYLVLTDRWPTAELHKMDGPRLAIDARSGMAQRICATIENWTYAQMPTADVCFVLNVPLEVALKRNISRTKNVKESDEEIASRYLQNVDFSPISRRTIHFSNSGNLQQMRVALLMQMWTALVIR